MIPTFPVPYYPMGNQYPIPLSDDAAKIFVGGIPADATKETLTEYFSKFGSVSDSIIMVDNITGRSRGFGFVTFIDAITVNKVLANNKHVINGKVVDAKRAVPKGPNQSSILRAMGITSNRADRNPDCKVFVGGVPQGTTESDLEAYFADYGNVLEVKIPKDQNTQRARGFSFVLFDNPECVVAATKEQFHRINGKMVEVKPVEIQQNKFNSSDVSSDDGHIQNPPSPYMPVNQRSGYYGYHHSYLGMSPAISPHGFYENPYEPSPSGSTGSAASIDSTGFGGLSTSAARGQGLDSYSYMAPLYPGMADLTIGQRYPALKNYAPMPRHYHLSGNQIPNSYTPGGAPSSSSHLYGDYSGSGAYAASNYTAGVPGGGGGVGAPHNAGGSSGGGGGGATQQIPAYTPVSAPSLISTNPAYSSR